MKALITGICGFVGGHLTRLLLSKGHEVVGLDAGDRESASDLGIKEVRVLKGDLRDEDVISKALMRLMLQMHIPNSVHWII